MLAFDLPPLAFGTDGRLSSFAMSIAINMWNATQASFGLDNSGPLRYFEHKNRVVDKLHDPMSY